jgi:hypothetical protein
VRYLRIVRAGQYARIAAAFRGVLSLNLRTCTVADLEAVHGIGPKTARMFLLHSRPAQRVAVLDTHILAWLAQCGVADVPRSTPPAGKHYERLELAFLDLCDKAGADPASLEPFAATIRHDDGFFLSRRRSGISRSARSVTPIRVLKNQRIRSPSTATATRW